MRKPIQIQTITSIGFETARCLLTWIIVGSVALPQLALAAPATANFGQVSGQVSGQISTAKITTTYAAGTAAASQISQISRQESLEEQVAMTKEWESYKAQLAPLYEKIAAKAKANPNSASDLNDPDQIEYDRILAKAEPVREAMERMTKVVGSSETFGVYTPPEGGDTQPATISVETQEPSEIEKAQTGGSPMLTEADMQKYFGNLTKPVPKTGMQKVAGSVGMFTTEYVGFSMATGVIALSQLMLADPRDPNAIENWEKQTLNLMGAAGFAFFMMGNHKIIKLYSRMRNHEVPSSMANYLGMSAGMLAQSMFSDLWRDQDMWKCVRPYYDTKAKPVAGACEKFRNDWLLVDNKIMQYTPAILGMMGSTALMQGGRFIATKALSKVPKNSNGYLKFIARGVRLVPKSQVIKKAGMFVGEKVFGLGNFVAFLVVDSYWVEEPTNQLWQDLRENHTDLKAWADNNLGFHSEFLWPKGYQPIQNAFDVVATTPLTAHTYLMEMYRKLQTSNWKQPAAVESCVPTAIAQAAKTTKADDTKDMWFWQRWLTEKSRSKSDAQLSCEVFARPLDLLSRYGEANKEWRGILLSPFNSSQANWIEMIAQFSQSYAASYQLAKFLATEKYNMVSKGQTQAPDLTREGLAKTINAPLPSDDDNADRPESEEHQSWFLDGTWVPTPELVDYVSAGAACGSEPVLAPANAEGGFVDRAYNGVYSFVARTMTSPNFISTPYGSSLRFVPPKLTNQSRAICQNVQSDLYSTVNYMVGGFLPNISNKPVTTNPFTGTFTDESGKNYASLVQYAFQNLDPEIYKATVIGPVFSVWWDSHFNKVIAPVWGRYDTQYKYYLDKYYVPALFDRTFREGCSTSAAAQRPKPSKSDATGLVPATTKTDASTSEQKCSDDSNAYRVSNGVFLAIETEMRNYLRGWFSLYVATLTKPKEKAAAKAAFMAQANTLINSVRDLDAKTLQSTNLQEKLTASQAVVTQMSAAVVASIGTDASVDGKFRLAMNKQFSDLLGQLLSEEQEHATTFHMLEFGYVKPGPLVSSPSGSGSGSGSGAAIGGAGQGLDSQDDANSLVSPGE